MTGRPVDLATWPRAETFRFFRGFERPHFATTSRVDVSAVMAARAANGLSPFRATLHAIGEGLHAVPDLRTRFRGDAVTIYERLRLSPTIAMADGGFRYAYLYWEPDWPAFDREAEAAIAEVRRGGALNPDTGATDDVAYLSCMPWLDYTAVHNALPGRDDCIPRVTWGKIVPKGAGYDMALTIEVHHALVDGRQVGDFFAATAVALARF